MFLILRGGSCSRSTTAGKDGLMRRPPAGNVLCIGNRLGPAWTTGQDREKTSRGLGPEPRRARGRHPSEGVVNPHFGVDPTTGGLVPLRKRQDHHDGDFTVLDGSFRDG